MAHKESSELVLDLSCAPLDLSVKRRPISISEHINGVAHFSFLDKVASKNATERDIYQIDVEAWDDSLWNVKSVLQLAEIREDWKTDEDTDSEDIAPWRCKVSVEATETMGFISRETIRDNDIDNSLNSGCGISENSDFFVFSDPPLSDTASRRDMDTVTSGGHGECVILSATEASDISRMEAESVSLGGDHGKVAGAGKVTEVSGVESVSPSGDGDEVMSRVSDFGGVKSGSSGVISAPFSRKRVFDHSLLDCWLNNDLEYTIGDKRWRFDLQGEINEVEDIGVDMPCDEAMIEVSDCEEGSDIVELPVVESNVESDSAIEDGRSILHDSDLQIFPAEEMKEPEEETDFEETFEAVITMGNESGVPFDSLEPLMLSDTDLDVDELLKANLKVEPNNNSDELFANLLIDLP